MLKFRADDTYCVDLLKTMKQRRDKYTLTGINTVRNDNGTTPGLYLNFISITYLKSREIGRSAILFTKYLTNTNLKKNPTTCYPVNPLMTVSRRVKGSFINRICVLQK